MIVRILIPSGPSVIEEAIVKLEVSPLKTGDGRIIVPATIATKDEHDYRDFLQKVQTFHPEEAVIVATAEDIPVPLRAETRYATRPCSNFPRPCIAIVGPWASAEERQALDVVLRRLAPDTGPK